MSKKFRKGPKTSEEKLYDLDRQFVDTVRVSTLDQIKDALVKLDKYETELLEAKSNDQDLASIREQLKVANQTYSEPLSAIKLKRKFAVQVLEEKKGTIKQASLEKAADALLKE